MKVKLPAPDPQEAIQRDKREDFVRRIYIKKGDDAKHGYSTGCRGCDAVANGWKARSHTKACSGRMIEELGKTDEGNRRLQEAEDRAEHRTKEAQRASRDAEVLRSKLASVDGGTYTLATSTAGPRSGSTRSSSSSASTSASSRVSSSARRSACRPSRRYAATPP